MVVGTVVMVDVTSQAAAQLAGECHGTSWLGCLLPHVLRQRLAICERVQSANDCRKLFSLSVVQLMDAL